MGVNNYLDKNLKTICYPISNPMAIVGKKLITYEPDSSDLVFINMEENQKNYNKNIFNQQVTRHKKMGTTRAKCMKSQNPEK